MEPNPEAATAAALKMHRVLVGRYDLLEHQLPDQYFDMVVCNDVIEHMDDHDAFLEAIKKKMRPGGWIVGSVPNVRHITALFKLLVTKDWKYSESGILDRTHLRFFTQKSLRRTLQEHGYSIEALGGVGSIIKYGISRRTNKFSWAQNLTYQVISLAVVVLTLGYYWDTQYPQYAFRVRLGAPPNPTNS